MRGPRIVTLRKHFKIRGSSSAAILVILSLVSGRQVGAALRQPSLDLDLGRCEVTGGAYPATPKPNGWELAFSRDEEKGRWTLDLLADLDSYPLLAFQVPELSRECAWSLIASDVRGKQQTILQPDG